MSISPHNMSIFFQAGFYLFLISLSLFCCFPLARFIDSTHSPPPPPLYETSHFLLVGYSPWVDHVLNRPYRGSPLGGPHPFFLLAHHIPFPPVGPCPEFPWGGYVPVLSFSAAGVTLLGELTHYVVQQSIIPTGKANAIFGTNHYNTQIGWYTFQGQLLYEAWKQQTNHSLVWSYGSYLPSFKGAYVLTVQSYLKINHSQLNQ